MGLIRIQERPVINSLHLTQQGVTHMAKRTVIESTELATIPELRPAAVIGVSSKVNIADALVPEEFRGATVEILDSGFAPTVKWNAVGDFAVGIFTGVKVVQVKRKSGIEDNNLYEFDANGKAFAIWGTTSIDQAMQGGIKSGIVCPGRKILIAYVGQIEVNQPEDMKVFQIRVAKVKSA